MQRWGPYSVGLKRRQQIPLSHLRVHLQGKAWTWRSRIRQRWFVGIGIEGQNPIWKSCPQPREKTPQGGLSDFLVALAKAYWFPEQNPSWISGLLTNISPWSNPIRTPIYFVHDYIRERQAPNVCMSETTICSQWVQSVSEHSPSLWQCLLWRVNCWTQDSRCLSPEMRDAHFWSPQLAWDCRWRHYDTLTKAGIVAWNDAICYYRLLSPNSMFCTLCNISKIYWFVCCCCCFGVGLRAPG